MMYTVTPSIHVVLEVSGQCIQAKTNKYPDKKERSRTVFILQMMR